MFGCRAGKRKAIQILWDLDEGMLGKIIQELLVEHCHLNLSITAQEADYIVDLIAQKLPCNYNAVYRIVSAPHCPQKIVPWVAAQLFMLKKVFLTVQVFPKTMIP